MRYSHILWDFNGTLLNDVNIGIESANILLKRHGLRELKNLEEYHSVFGFPIIEYYRRLGFDFSKTPYNDLAVEWVEIYDSLANKAFLYKDALQLLKLIQDSTAKQLILSATELKMLTKQLKSLGIYGYFDDVLGTGNIYAYSKKEIAIKWVKECSPEFPVLIGDTTHDYEVAMAAGFDCILVANGHESKNSLLKTTSTVVDSLKEVFNLL